MIEKNIFMLKFRVYFDKWDKSRWLRARARRDIDGNGGVQVGSFRERMISKSLKVLQTNWSEIICSDATISR